MIKEYAGASEEPRWKKPFEKEGTFLSMLYIRTVGREAVGVDEMCRAVSGRVMNCIFEAIDGALAVQKNKKEITARTEEIPDFQENALVSTYLHNK